MNFLSEIEEEELKIRESDSERDSDFQIVPPKTRSQARHLDLLLGDNGSPPGTSNSPDNDANQAVEDQTSYSQASWASKISRAISSP